MSLQEYREFVAKLEAVPLGDGTHAAAAVVIRDLRAALWATEGARAEAIELSDRADSVLARCEAR